METKQITWQLEHEKINRLLLHYAAPAVMGMLVNTLYNIVDRIFIGHGVGALAISGLTLTFPVTAFIQAFSMLVGIGAATHVSIYLGKKANDMAENIVGNALVLSVIVAIFTTLPPLVFMDELLESFGGSEQTLPYAKDYLYIIVPFNLMNILSLTFNSIMRASGYPKKAMGMLLLGATLNVILDPLFIFVFNMGIRGAAVATVISMAASTLCIMLHFFSEKSILRFRLRYLRLRNKIVKRILGIGISPFFMQLVGCAEVIIINRALGMYGGDLAIGANGIISSIGLLFVMLIIGIGQGMQPIIGFNHGANHPERVMKTLRLAIISSTLITGVGCIVSVFIPDALVCVFSTDAELVRITSNGLRLTMLTFFAVGSQIIISLFFQSMGMAWKAMLLSLSRQFFFQIPALFILPLFWQLNGIWLAEPLADVLSALLAWMFLWNSKFFCEAIQK